MTTVSTIILWTINILVGLLLSALIARQVIRVYLKHSTNIKTPNGISSLETINLGGLDQSIFIRSEDQNNPILVFLHGGPGAPLLGMSSSRTRDANLIKHFTIVHWDQRGAGKSHSRGISTKSMTVNQFVKDCNELIDHLRKRFKKQKVYLVSHSWGTIVGTKVANKHSQKIHAYIGIGQIISDYEQQKVSFNFAVKEAQKSGIIKDQKALKKIGPPPYDSAKEIISKDNYIAKYGGVSLGGLKEIFLLSSSYLTSPEYTLKEGLRSFMAKEFHWSLDNMWKGISKVDLAKEIRSIKIPMYFFLGKYDMATPTIIVKKFLNQLSSTERKNKTLIIVNRAHFPMNEKQIFEDLLINKVLNKQSVV